MVLEDHVKRKRRLIPPVRAALGESYSPFSWSLQIVPELFWITVLIDELGPERGVEVARQLGNVAAGACTQDPKPLFVSMASFSKLSDAEKEQLLKSIEESTIGDVRAALGRLTSIWPENPLSFLGLKTEESIESVLASLSPRLEAMYDRHSRESTLAISTAVYVGFDQDKIKIAKEVFEKNETAFKDVEDYPTTEASKKAGSFFRAMAPMLLMMEEDNGLTDWMDQFWNGLSSIGGCHGEYQDVPALPKEAKGLEGFIAVYTHFAHQDFRSREDLWELDLGKPQERQVILALLARQATLAIEIISNPGIWNPNTAPILLRSMADIHIALVWLIQDPAGRVPLYVQDGLGAIKLEIAHRKAEQEKVDPKHAESQAAYIEHLEHWLDAQQLEFLTEVNLGSWSGKSTRVMAQESDCIDFYNYVFQPFSSAVHSYWSHVGRLNVEYCRNPAHNFHLLPMIHSFDPDPHWCKLAGKYYSKSLRAFDEFKGEAVERVVSSDVIADAFRETGDDAGRD